MSLFPFRDNAGDFELYRPGGFDALLNYNIAPKTCYKSKQHQERRRVKEEEKRQGDNESLSKWERYREEKIFLVKNYIDVLKQIKKVKFFVTYVTLVKAMA